MAERKSTNKYYPPEWDPSKGSLNTFHGSHPLRERASRLKSHGILVIRFEMPFPVYCTACHSMIDKGVRFNADKQRIGNYFTTPLFSFSMRCPLCSNNIRIETDPKARDYAVVEGARRKEVAAVERAEDDGQLVVGVEEAEQRQRATDVMARVERSTVDERKARSADPVLLALLERNERMKDDFAQSQRLRMHNRQQREEWQSREKEREEKGLRLQLLPSNDDDRAEAAGRRYGHVETAEEGRRRRKRERSGARIGRGSSVLDESERQAVRLQRTRAVQALTAESVRERTEREDRLRQAQEQGTVRVKRKAVERTAAEDAAQEESESVSKNSLSRVNVSSDAMASITAYSSEDEADGVGGT